MQVWISSVSTTLDLDWSISASCLTPSTTDEDEGPVLGLCQ